MASAKKVTVMLGFVPIHTKFEVAVDKEDAGKNIHTVCVGILTPHDPVRIKQSVSCPHCKVTHSWSGAFGTKGTERDGKMVVLTQEELSSATGTPINGKEVPVTLALHDREKVYAATLPSEGVHNVIPDKGGEKTYVLLRDTLKARPNLVGVAVWAPSSKNALWVFEVVDERIVASKRCWPEDVRAKPGIAPAEYTEVEAAQFAMMVDGSVQDFDLGTYVDLSRANKEELIASKTGEAVPVGVTAPPSTPPGDLLAAIQATLDAQAKTAAPKVVKTAKKPAKKVAAKKVAAPRRRKESAA